MPAATVKPGGGCAASAAAVARSSRLRRSARSIAPRRSSTAGQRRGSPAAGPATAASAPRARARRRQRRQAGGGTSSISQRIERPREVGGEPQRLRRAVVLARGPARQAPASRASGSIAGGIGSLASAGSSAPPIRSSSSGSPIGDQPRQQQPARRWRARTPRSPSAPRDCWAAGCARRRGQRIAPVPRASAPRPAHRRRRGARGW